ncbi:MAG: HAMP domain-containing sensor histidine kinase [Oscillospiraceae bacterium]|nr:HAMP domain-containing sensor histidine kinase [Eubacteriales bacterium]MDY2617389.1 HAMP domain-containing sensor histidine kinase [Oscillospiraceae bacterium]
MRNNLFRRQFLLTAGLILLSFILLAASFTALSYRYMVREKKESMEENVSYAASMTQVILQRGFDPAEDAFPIYGPALSHISDSDLVLCDASGTVLRYIADGADVPDYVGSAISSDVTSQMIQNGIYSGMSDLGIYSGVHFAAGAPIFLQTGQGDSMQYFIFMTASATDLVVLWKSLATLFFFVAVIVMCVACIACSIFSMQQVKPLREMADAVRRFGMGEYDVRVDDTGHKDEIGDLASAFNAMADSLANSEKRRQEFVANISHELKTPMTTISGFTNGILDGTIPPEKVNDSLQVISSETARLSRLVRRMLDVSALQARESVQSQVEFDISETMVQVMISLEGKIKNRQLDMDVHIPDDPVRVWGDPDGITQVCYNLLDNAAKFAAPGTAIAVTITTKGTKAYISVKNQGETIPPDELNMIFDRFHKSDRSRSIDKEGVGLGLYIVKTILNNHKENITVTSKDGVTEFIFTLTLAG